MKELTSGELQDVSLDILVNFHNFCVKNDIHYSLSGGTLLGAIRHNGFIPWDDDIDVQMTRPDYERFVHLYRSGEDYKLFAYEREDGGNAKIPYARLCEMKKTYVDQGVAPWVDEAVGVWIDILPVDGAPDNRMLAKLRIMWMYILWRLSVIAREDLDLVKDIPALNNKFANIVRIIIKKLLPDDFLDYYIKQCKKYDFEDSTYFANYAVLHYKFKEWQPKKFMASYSLHRFEESEFFIMNGYDGNLKCLYGDYMQLPPEEKRVKHEFYRYYWK